MMLWLIFAMLLTMLIVGWLEYILLYVSDALTKIIMKDLKKLLIIAWFFMALILAILYFDIK